MSKTPRPIPIEMWGKDHWSTFAYIETRCVDHKGIPELCRMRCDSKIHPMLQDSRIAMANFGDKKYPTILKHGMTEESHDDWSCAEEMEHFGLLENVGTGIHPIFVLTEKGKNVAAQLRSHKMDGKNFASFEPKGI